MQRPFSNLIFATGLNFILATAALFLFLHSGIHSDHAAKDRVLPQLKAIRPEIRQDFQISIKLFTFDRLESLSHCLESLAKANYGDDSVHLHIFVDHFKIEEPSPTQRKGSLHLTLKGLRKTNNVSNEGPSVLASYLGTTLIDENLRTAREILRYIDGFNWPYGRKEVHYRTQNAGLQRQWLEAWWPSSDNEFAFIVEDDMVLSPLFYMYLKKLLKTYYFDPTNYDPLVYGISLQRPRFVPGKRGNLLQLDNSTRLFLYQLVGTWGQLLFPKPWKEFRLWYDGKKSKGIRPFLEGMVTTGWYVKLGEKIWTPWFIKFVHSKGYYNLYTNFLNERALSISYRDVGVNARRKAGPDSKLIDANGAPDIDLWEMKPMKSMKKYNYCFQEVSPRKLIMTFDDLEETLTLVQRRGDVILVSTLGIREELVRNWLCHQTKLGFRHLVLLAEAGKLSEDLLQRGHSVMHIVSSAIPKPFQNVDDARILKALVWILQLGYNVWLTRADTLWVDDPFHHLPRFDADILGMVGDGVFTEFVYFRSCEKTIQLCRGIEKSIAVQARSFTYMDHDLGFLLWQGIIKAQVNFQVVNSSLTTNVSYLMKDGESNSTTTGPFLSGFGKTNLNMIIDTLKGLGFWMLDEDLACTGIFCHPRI